VFNPAAARTLLDRCLSRGDAGQFSNADNMAVVGVLSTQALFDRLIRRRAQGTAIEWTTGVDRVAAAARETVSEGRF